MNALQMLNDLGQRIWLDNITRDLLDSGTLQRYIDEFAVTGLTSNPSIFDAAINKSSDYDAAIAQLGTRGLTGEELFFELAVQDLTRAADMFRPIHAASHGIDGWVSLEVSPLLADDTEQTVNAARTLYAKAGRDNLFIKIPGTPAGIPAIEQAVFEGIPINVTLLFSRSQYLAAAHACMRGLERRIAGGLAPDVASVASMFISRWDVAVHDKVPSQLRNRLGIAIGVQCHAAYRDLLAQPRWRKLAAAGAPPQRMLWASTGTKDPAAPDTLYVEALAAEQTINTMPEATLRAFAEHGKIGSLLPNDAAHAETMLAEFRRNDVDIDALALQLQIEGTAAFDKSWKALMEGISAKTGAIREQHA